MQVGLLGLSLVLLLLCGTVPLTVAIQCRTLRGAELLLLRVCQEDVDCREYNYLQRPSAKPGMLTEYRNHPYPTMMLEQAEAMNLIIQAGTAGSLQPEQDMYRIKWPVHIAVRLPRIEWGALPIPETMRALHVRPRQETAHILERARDSNDTDPPTSHIWDCMDMATAGHRPLSTPILKDLVPVLTALHTYRTLIADQQRCFDDNERAIRVGDDIHCSCIEGQLCNQVQHDNVFIILFGVLFVFTLIFISVSLCSTLPLVNAVRAAYGQSTPVP